MWQQKGDMAALKAAGEKLGRSGLSERVIDLVAQFNEDSSYKKAIELSGRLRAIAMACQFDQYWDEKMSTGYYHELNRMKSLIGKHID